MRKTNLKKYEIHNNGSRPFLVEVRGLNVSVARNTMPPVHMFTVHADEVFVGKKSPKGGYDGLPAGQAEGNSILLAIGAKYMYIGSIIYEFSPMKGDTIVKYYSNIGGSDTPYPYAIGKSHVYIMLDGVAVHKSYFDMKEDIYEQHYYPHRIQMCLYGNPKSDICKDRDVYESRIAEWKDKTTNLRKKFLFG